MGSGEIFRLIEDEPDMALALSMSAPAVGEEPPPSRQFAVEMNGEELVVRGPVPQVKRRREAHLYCTKEAIAAAMLLYRLWRGDESWDASATVSSHEEIKTAERERRLSQVMVECAGSLALQFSKRNFYLSVDQDNSISSVHREVIDRLKVSPSTISEVEARCGVVFGKLEERGWIVDPGFVVQPDTMMMVGLGLVPMQWSVRTPKGERVYREIRINAPLWSLSLDRIRAGSTKRTDWQFNFRGIGFVKGLLRQFALHYLASEERLREDKGKPTLPAPKDMKVEDDEL